MAKNGAAPKNTPARKSRAKRPTPSTASRST